MFQEEHKRLGKVRGSLKLAGAIVSPSDEDSLAFVVVPQYSGEDTFKLKASSTKQRQVCSVLCMHTLFCFSWPLSRRLARTHYKHEGPLCCAVCACDASDAIVMLLTWIIYFIMIIHQV